MNATLVIDNYDSFTWNLVDILRRLGDHPTVVRNDDPTLGRTRFELPRRLLVSPGPGKPAAAGHSLGVLESCVGRVPVLGVCLGHQALGQLCGMTLIRCRVPRHGRAFTVRHDGLGVFAGVPDETRAARYHSLVLDPATLSDDVVATAWTNDAGERLLMGIRHRRFPAESVQFHPESFMSEHGTTMLRNFLEWEV